MNRLERVTAWIDTMADRRDMSGEQADSAKALAERELDERRRPLPKTVARESVESVRMEGNEENL